MQRESIHKYLILKYFATSTACRNVLGRLAIGMPFSKLAIFLARSDNTGSRPQQWLKLAYRISDIKFTVSVKKMSVSDPSRHSRSSSLVGSHPSSPVLRWHCLCSVMH